jgi:hypothetical protein
MTNNNSDNNLITLEMNELKSLESEIARKISPILLDYVFLFTPDVEYQIHIDQLQKEGRELLNKYIILSDNLLKKMNIEPQKKLNDIVEDFLTSIRDMYLLRYVDAKSIFSNYEFIRIPTFFEEKLKDTKQEETLTFIIPNGLVLNEIGEIDPIGTIKSENENHIIARYISAYKHSRLMSEQMFSDLRAISTKAFAYPIFSKQLKELTSEVLYTAVFHLTGEVYKYTDKNYSLQDSMTNVYEYFIQIAQQGNTAVIKAIPVLFAELKEKIEFSLSKIIDLNTDTKAIILDDYFELIIAYIKAYKILPKDYYRIGIRNVDKFNDYEKKQNYSTLLDLFLITPEGQIVETPLETFNLALTNPAKILIFKTVVGEIENPKLTLKHYLEL